MPGRSRRSCGILRRRSGRPCGTVSRSAPCHPARGPSSPCCGWLGRPASVRRVRRSRRRHAADARRRGASIPTGPPVLELPPWDSPPYDRSRPSRAVTGRRVTTLAWLAEHHEQRVLVLTTPESLTQRIPHPMIVCWNVQFALNRGSRSMTGGWKPPWLPSATSRPIG